MFRELHHLFDEKVDDHGRMITEMRIDIDRGDVRIERTEIPHFVHIWVTYSRDVAVPMLIVSPFTRGGLVCPDTFDHTSMLRFIETRFGVEVPNLSAWRRATTGDLTASLNLAAPDFSIPSLPQPETAVPAVVAQCTVPQLSSYLIGTPQPAYPLPPTQSLPHQERGRTRRPSGPCRGR